MCGFSARLRCGMQARLTTKVPRVGKLLVVDYRNPNVFTVDPKRALPRYS